MNTQQMIDIGVTAVDQASAALVAALKDAPNPGASFIVAATLMIAKMNVAIDGLGAEARTLSDSFAPQVQAIYASDLSEHYERSMKR